MKHKGKIVALLIAIFVLSQVIGLYVTSNYAEKESLPLNIERPQVENKTTSFLPIALFIIIGTILLLVLIHFNLGRVWRIWFFFSIFLTLVISFSAFIDERIAIIAGLAFALIRILKNNVVIHNLTEIFIYGAMAALLTPILNITSAILLLLLISVYDYIAVRKTKHMISLAKFQGKSKIFAGLMIPYGSSKKSIGMNLDGKIVSGKSQVKEKVKSASIAILGGGDMGFPLLFAATVMLQLGLSIFDYRTYIIPLFATISLAGLFILGSDKKFYPAMPYISAGCFVGYGILRLLL